MKLLRYGQPGEEKPAILDQQGNIRDLSQQIDDIAGDNLLPQQIAKLRQIDVNALPMVDKQTVRLGPCVNRVGKLICIGLNYYDHAAEIGASPLEEPLIFNKATSSICGPNDNIVIPRGATKTDWEVELGVVIGAPAKYVAVDEALNHVAGYCIVNDVSERAYQMERCGQWTKGKSCDSFGPLGPWLVTSDEIADPQNLDLWLSVDGQRYQDSNSSQMIFTVAYLVSYLSQFFTLHAGDVIATGTPAGVGLGIKPQPIYLRPGQTVRLGITGLGEQCQYTVRDDSD